MTDTLGISMVERLLERPLTDLQKAIFTGAWQSKSYKQIALETGYSEKHVKDLGHQLWRSISDALGEPISKPKLKLNLEKWLDSDHLQKINQCRDWGSAPDVPFFIGRSQELETLKKWILDDRCRLVSILGMRGVGKTRLSLKLGKGGIGKTDLTLQLARGVQSQFEVVIWRSLLNSPPLEKILTDWIKCLSAQTEVVLPPHLDDRLARLLHYLQHKRCLLILDNVETILQGQSQPRQYLEGYEDYGTLLRTLGEADHQSCLMLTSREKPQEIALLEYATGPVRSLELTGLNDLSCRKIFARVGKFEASETQWKNINHFYDGKPLALELAAKHIQAVYNGKVGAFLGKDTPIFADLRDLLDWHFQRLSEPELELAYWMALNREPISLEGLQQDVLQSAAKKAVPSTLQSLQRCLPVEISDNGITLQPVLIEYFTESYIEQAIAECQADQFNLLHQFAVLKALAKDYVRSAQIRLVVLPIAEELKAALGGLLAYEKKLNLILNQSKQDNALRHGYLAGNIINLLIQFSINLRNYNFSDLSIRQVYFQEAFLVNVDFSNTEVKHSSFLQYFGNIFSGQFSPDGKKIAISDDNGRVEIIHIDSCQQVLSLQANQIGIWENSVVFSPDGQFLVSGGADCQVKLWEFSTGHLLHAFMGHESWVWCVTVSPDGRTIASGGDDRTVMLWAFFSKQRLRVLEGHQNCVRCVAFSPNGTLLASGGHDCTARIWDVQTGQCLRVIEHPHWVLSVGFSPDSQTLICAAEMKVWVWDIQTGNCLKTLEGHHHFLLSSVLSPNGKLIASASLDCTVKIWDLETTACLRTLIGHSDWVFAIGFSPDGQTLFSCGYDNTLKLWNVKTGDCVSTLKGYCNWVYGVAFSPGEQAIASAHQDGSVRIWDGQTGNSLSVFPGQKSIHTVAFSPDGQTLASGSHDSCIRLWNMATADCIATLHVGQAGGGVWSVVFSPDGTRLASGSQDGMVRIWEVASRRLLNTLAGHQNWIWSVAFSPDGTTLASTSDDKTVKLWDTASGQCLKTIDDQKHKFMSAAFSPNGELLAIAGQADRIFLWHIASEQFIAGLQGHRGPVMVVVFSPDGQILASGSTDQTILLWDLNAQKQMYSLQGHHSNIRSLAFSPDSKILISGSQDGTLKQWDVVSRKLCKTLRPERPYEGMNIAGITGLSSAQKNMLESLGAIESDAKSTVSTNRR